MPSTNKKRLAVGVLTADAIYVGGDTLDARIVKVSGFTDDMAVRSLAATDSLA